MLDPERRLRQLLARHIQLRSEDAARDPLGKGACYQTVALVGPWMGRSQWERGVAATTVAVRAVRIPALVLMRPMAAASRLGAKPADLRAHAMQRRGTRLLAVSVLGLALGVLAPRAALGASPTVSSATSMPADANVRIDPRQASGGEIPGHFVGVSIEWSLIDRYMAPASRPGFANLLNNLGSGLLRIGGTLTSTAAEAALSVLDAGVTAPGRLANGSFALSEPLQARVGSNAFAPLGTTPSSPLPLVSYGSPVSNDNIAISFRQHIGSSEPLRSGTYNKTLTFTLSTTTP